MKSIVHTINLKPLLILLAVAGFQSCSKISYSDVAAEAGNVGLSTDELPNNSETPINQPPAVINPGDNDSSGTPDDSLNPPSSEPPVLQPPVSEPPSSEPPGNSNPPVGDNNNGHGNDDDGSDDSNPGNPPSSEPPVAGEPPVSEPPTAGEPPVSQPPTAGEPPVSEPPTAGEPPVSEPPTAGEPPVSEPPTAGEPPVSQPPTAGEPPVSEPPTAGEPPVSIPPIAGPINPPGQDDKCVDWALEKKDLISATANSQKSNNGNGKGNGKGNDKAPNANSLTTGNDKPKCHVKDDEIVDPEEICGLSAEAKNAINAINNFLSVFQIRGFTVIAPETVGTSRLDLIDDVRGHAIICNMAVEKINNTRGMLSIVNSDVNELNDHRGAVILKNTKVNTCSNINGLLAIVGNSVCHNVENSKGSILVNR